VNPRIFYTDLESGPNTGGENGFGAFVTIRGAHFGTAAGTVTVGGGAAARIVSWSDTQVVIQLGPEARSGDIVVHAGQASNGAPFTVRGGNIYFVAVGGNDAAGGSFTAPWRTIQNAVTRMQAGDIAYVRDGVKETRADSRWGSVTIRGRGAPGQPIAVVAYPGASATIGAAGATCSATNCVEGIKVWNSVDPQWWVIAGLKLHASNYGMQLLGNTGQGIRQFRIVNNEFYCPNGSVMWACLSTSRSENITVLGNHLRQAGNGTSPGLKLYHGFYFGTDSNYVDVGWNVVEKVRGCRGILVHSSKVDSQTGYSQHHIRIHDNTIRDTVCDGIGLATVDPSRGPVEVFNNVILRTGEGSSYTKGPYACVGVQGYTNNGTPGQGTVEVYNNSVADCGVLRGYSAGAFFKGDNANLNLRLTNNVMYQFTGEEYVTVSEGQVTGGANHMYGTGRLRSSTVAAFVNTESPFVSFGGGDLHLRPNSGSRRLSMSPAPPADIAGVDRLLPGALGAYEEEESEGEAGPALQSVQCAPAEVESFEEAVCTASLTGPAAAAATVAIRVSGPITAPAPVTIPAGASSGEFRVTANAVTAITMASVEASLGGVIKTFAIEVLPPAPSPAPELDSLSCAGAQVTTGATLNCVVSLTAPAGSPVAVSIRSTGPLAVPASVTVPVGARSASFPITGLATSTTGSVRLVAELGGLMETVVIQVSSGSGGTAVPAELAGIGCRSVSIAVGESTECEVRLTGAAPSPVMIGIWTTGQLAIPATVTVPAGASSARFTITGLMTSTTVRVRLGALLNGKTVTVVIELRR
jgi:hypothetical protein